MLHDHLDGGLRPSTIIELAKKDGVSLPVDNEQELKDWFFENISSKNNQVFKKFELTISLMQNFENIERIAYEAVMDLRSENVIYGELRFAPFQHQNDNLSLKDIVKAASNGLIQGEKDFGGKFNLILCAMRQHNNSLDVAKLAIDSTDIKVVGFDLAGPEYNYPPKLHLDACMLIKKAGLGLTIHAGEAADISYIEQAIFDCKADRVGHGWQIIYGCKEINDKFIPNGRIAEYVLENQIPLEICISSNIKSGASEVTIDNHPAIKLLNGGFKVTLNTDNRLMAKTSVLNEFNIASEKLNMGSNDKAKLIENSFDVVFSN